MSDPFTPHAVIIKTERYSDTINLHHMSDDTFIYGCTWPKCDFALPTNKDSIPSHYKHHVGAAAQRRRAQQRPRSAVVSNEVLEAALALLDMTQELIDKLAAFDDEYTAMKHTVDEHNIVVEDLRQQIEVNRWKAERYDRMEALLRDNIAVWDDDASPT